MLQGLIDIEELHRIECDAMPRSGTCSGMFTANTMASACGGEEALNDTTSHTHTHTHTHTSLSLCYVLFSFSGTLDARGWQLVCALPCLVPHAWVWQGKSQLLHPATPYYPFPRVKIHTRGNIWSFTVG